MAAEGYQPELEDLTLANVAKGALEVRFQEFLGKMRSEVVAQIDEHARDKNNRVKVRMSFDLEFLLAENDGRVEADVIAGASFKPPTLIKKGESVFLRGDRYLVWGNEPAQDPLPGMDKVSPINRNRAS